MQQRNIFRQQNFMGLLAGLLLVLFFSAGCANDTGAAPATPPSQAQIPQSSTEVSYPGVNGVTLAGTLLIPAHQQGKQVPGVVIVAGSGPTDRNGNQAGGEQTNMYKQLAEDLVQHGIASLRYDKRGVGKSTPVPLPKDSQHPTPAEIAALQQFQAWQNFVGDAAASLRYLQSQPAIDSSRTAMLGHSEGTYISEEVATTLPASLKAPAALVLAGAPGRPIDQVLREQIFHLLQQEQASTVVESFVFQQYNKIIAGIKQTGQIPQQPLLNVETDPQVPLATKRLFAELFNITLNQFWAGELQAIPITLVSKYRGPVLLLQGTSDPNVSATEDTPLLDSALAQRPQDDHTTLLVPGANHYLKAVTASNPGITGSIESQVLSTLPTWLNQKLG